MDYSRHGAAVRIAHLLTILTCARAAYRGTGTIDSNNYNRLHGGSARDLMISPLTSSNSPLLWESWNFVVYLELGLPGQPDFICSGVMVGNVSLLTSPSCFDSATEAPVTSQTDWQGTLRALKPYAIYAGPNRTLVGIARSHHYVNSPGTDGYRLSLVNMTRLPGADAIGLGWLPTLSSPISVPAEGILLSYGPDAVTQLGPASYSWTGEHGTAIV